VPDLLLLLSYRHEVDNEKKKKFLDIKMIRLKNFENTIFIFLLAMLQCDILPDFEPPNVRILSPKSGETAFGSVEILAEARDNKRLDRMELYLDGELVKTVWEKTVRFTWDLTETNIDAEHTIRVKAIDRSGNWDNAEVKFFGYGKSPAKPTLLSPGQGISIAFTDRVLDWTDLPDIQSYHVQVDDNDDFSSPFISDISVKNSDFTISVPLEYNMTYYWRISAKYDWANWGDWSETRMFTTIVYKWRYWTGAEVISSPAIGFEGTIYFGGGNRFLNALNKDGTLKWKYETGAYVDSSPAIGTDGTIYFGSGDSYLYALNPDGTLKWKFDTNGFIASSPAIGNDGIVFFGSGDGYLYALNSEGNLIWKYNTHSHNSKSPVIHIDGTIIINSSIDFSGYLYAINPNGTLKWRYQTGSGGGLSSPAIAKDGTIYSGSSELGFCGFDTDGNLKFSLPLILIRGAPAIGSDETIYVTSRPGLLYALTSDNILKWEFDTGSLSAPQSPTIGSDGTIYVGVNYGYLYALNPDGSLKRKYQLFDRIRSSPAIGADGTIYVGSDDGYLYALPGFGSGLANSPWPKFQHDNQNTGRAGN